MSLEFYRKKYITEFNNQIKSKESQIKRNESAIKNMRDNTSFNERKNKLTLDNINLLNDIEDLHDNIISYNRGEHDDDISDEIKNTNIRKEKKQPEKKKKHKFIYKKPKFDSDYVYSGYKISEQFREFKRDADSFPDYMRKKLKNMSSNEGYIWRGIYFYGEKYTNKLYPTRMFEKNNGILYIRECHENYIKIFKRIKTGNRNKDILIETIPRKKIC